MKIYKIYIIYVVTIACKGVARSVFNRLQDEFILLLEQTISIKIEILSVSLISSILY